MKKKIIIIAVIIIAIIIAVVVFLRKNTTNKERTISQNTQTTESGSNNSTNNNNKDVDKNNNVNSKTTNSTKETKFNGLVEDGVFSITDVISEAEEIIVPDNIDGVTVGKIKKEAFYDLQCKKIVIPNTVTSIGKSAFLNCVNLETIELGTGITSVGASAFSGCKQLKSVTFADGLVTIKGTIFYDCRALEEAFIPASATDIEHGLGNAETCPKLVVVTPTGSRAEAVAKGQGVPVRNK